ncbi:MAG: hypothetical protein QXV17_07090 [Candidatus Micrarchaeaceae archaeon]
MTVDNTLMMELDKKSHGTLKFILFDNENVIKSYDIGKKTVLTEYRDPRRPLGSAKYYIDLMLLTNIRLLIGAGDPRAPWLKFFSRIIISKEFLSEYIKGKRKLPFFERWKDVQMQEEVRKAASDLKDKGVRWKERINLGASIGTKLRIMPYLVTISYKQGFLSNKIKIETRIGLPGKFSKNRAKATLKFKNPMVAQEVFNDLAPKAKEINDYIESGEFERDSNLE